MALEDPFFSVKEYVRCILLSPSIPLLGELWCQDTSDPGHFGPGTFRHHQTGAEVSGHFGISAELY